MTPTQLVMLVLVPLVVWRIYSRTRRNIGRQLLRPTSLMVRVAFLGVITGLVTAAALRDLASIEAELAGLALGAVLAFVGLKLTRFEMTTEGNFYIPNAYLGVALTVLFVSRIAYRFMQLAQNAGGFDRRMSAPSIFQSPLTLLIFGVTAGYYLAYTTGILVRGRKLI